MYALLHVMTLLFDSNSNSTVLLKAARLSNACGTIKKLGIDIRTRPFGYQDAAQDDLDSFLLFTSSFVPQVKLFRIPISTPYLWGAFVTSCFIVLLLAQQGVLSSGVF
jgi:hypothetical protein